MGTTVVVASKRVPKSDADVDPQKWAADRDREEAAQDKLELPSASDVKDAAKSVGSAVGNAVKAVGRYAKPSDNPDAQPGMKKGGKVMKKGGKVKSSASKRADGIAVKGHTRGKYL
jgi:hypothetical protein